MGDAVKTFVDHEGKADSSIPFSFSSMDGWMMNEWTDSPFLCVH